MRSFSEIIDQLGGYRSVADGMPRPLTTVQSWHQRNSIPPNEWPAVVAYADKVGVEGVTVDLLARLMIARRQRAA